LRSSMICSMVLPRVSGTLSTTKATKSTRTAAKGKNAKAPSVVEIGINACPQKKLASQLQVAVIALPCATLSTGKSSAGSSHGHGPMPTPKLITKPTTAIAASGDAHGCPAPWRLSVRMRIDTTYGWGVRMGCKSGM